MKAKNQQHYTSEVEAKDKLIIFVYEYLVHSGAKVAADKFIESIGYNKIIEIKEGPGFLIEWWCVFWDLYCATPERRHLQPESSSDARAFHDFMRAPMSPSITQTSPPQQHIPQYITAGPRHQGPPPHHPRGPPPRMQAGPQPPHHHLTVPPGPPSGYITSPSPRYGQHIGPPTQQTQINQAGPHPSMAYGPGPDQVLPSPVMNRMSNVAAPPQQIVGSPGPNGPPMVGMPSHQMGGPPPPHPANQASSQVNSMQGANAPPRAGIQGGWHRSFNVNSPAEQQCFIPPNQSSGGQPSHEFNGILISDSPGMMDMKSTSGVSSNNTSGSGNPTNNNNGNSNNGQQSSQSQQQSQQQQEEYIMPSAYSQQSTDQGGDAGSEIRMLKESLEIDANEGDQSGFSIDYAESQGKW